MVGLLCYADICPIQLMLQAAVSRGHQDVNVNTVHDFDFWKFLEAFATSWDLFYISFVGLMRAEPVYLMDWQDAC